MAIARKILVAEDEDFNYELIRMIFQREDIDVLRAENGLQAVEIVRASDAIGLVLMDIKMPHMNGLDATRQIKLYDRSMPVIALTAYAMEDDREMCLRAGCDDFITKPVNRELLVKTAHRWMKR